MNEEDAASMTEMSDSRPEGTARNAGEYGRSASSVTADREATDPRYQTGLIEAVVSAPNIATAFAPDRRCVRPAHISSKVDGGS